MKATRVLPESYLLYHHFDETKYRKATWVVVALGLLVFVASFTFLNNLAGTLRSEYQPVERLQFELTLERLVILLRLLVPIAIILILHEGIHALCLWSFTHELLIFVATFEGLAGIGVMSNTGIGLWVFCVSLNLAGSISDVLSSIYVYLHPSSAYIKTDGRIYHPHRPETVSRWKQRLRSVMERFSQGWSSRMGRASLAQSLPVEITAVWSLWSKRAGVSALCQEV